MKVVQKSDSCNSNVCSYRIAFILDNWVRKLLQAPGKILGEYIHEGDTVIDLGCGPGYFTIEMAKRVGTNGKVIAVDLQEEMLVYVRKKAEAKHVADRIQYHRCQKDSLDIELKNQVDFMLAFYMIHETPAPDAFFKELRPLLKEGGKFLVVEPSFHVKQKAFEGMLEMGEKAGFNILEFPRKKGGRSVVFTVMLPKNN